MKFHIYHHYDDTKIDLVKLETKLAKTFQKTFKLLEIIMESQAEVVEKLKAVAVKLGKIGNESTQTLAKVEELKVALAKAIEDGGKVTQELQDAVHAVEAQVQVVDDLVPDAVEPTPAV